MSDTGYLLPGLALVLAVAAALLRDTPAPRAAEPEGAPTRLWKELTLRRALLSAPPVVAVLLLLLVAYAPLGLDDTAVRTRLVAGAGGFLLGALLADLAIMMEAGRRSPGASGLMPLGLGVAALGVTRILSPPDVLGYVELGLVAGSALGAWVLRLGPGAPPGLWAPLTALVCGVGAASNLLGAEGPGGNAGQTGLALGVAALFAGVLGFGLASFLGRQQGREAPSRALALGLTTVILLLAALLLSQRFLFLFRAWTLFAGAVVLAWVTHWLLPTPALPRGTAEDAAPPEGRPTTREALGGEVGGSTFRFALAAVLWVSAGTAAFGILRGYGMATALLGGIAVLTLILNPRALLSLGLLLSLTLYRVFRELFTDASRAFDIGQHYAMVGLLLAALLPLLLLEWRRALPRDWTGGRAALTGALWMLLALGLPLGAAAIIGSKGVVGYLVGLGLAAIIEGFREEPDPESLALAAGLAAAMTLGFAGLAPHLELAREAKVLVLYRVGVLAALVAIAIALLTPRRRAGTL